MTFHQKLKVRIFGPQTLHNRRSLFVSVAVFALTLVFVGGASAKMGWIPIASVTRFFPQAEKVLGIETQDSTRQVAGNCPASGLTYDAPPTARPFPLPNTIASDASISSGEYSVSGTLTVKTGTTLTVNGDVKIYANSVVIEPNAIVNANGTGNPGGRGGEATHTIATSGSVTRATPDPFAGDGVGYCANGAPGCTYTTYNLGGGASKSYYVPPDGAGGGGHAGNGGGGSNYSGQPGGAANFAGAQGDYAVRMGGGGGGGYCKQDSANTKCYGGNGGGAISFFATNFTSQGTIQANGQSAPNIGHTADTVIYKNPTACKNLGICVVDHYEGYQQAAGGGGAGGGILISAKNLSITGALKAAGGNGGSSCTDRLDCPDDDDAGGGGAGGEIKVFHDPAGTYVFTNNVDISGGTHGDQVKSNLPQNGSGGLTTDGRCDGPNPACTDWSFALTDYSASPARGDTVHIGAPFSAAGAQGKSAGIKLQLNQYETVDPSKDLGLVYGDWHGAQFTATKDHHYQVCYDLRAGAGIDPMPLGTGDGAVSVEFGTQQTGVANKNIQNGLRPVLGSWLHKTTSFQATWSTTVASYPSAYIGFRTGAAVGGWFTGDLDIDKVGVFDCGTSAACNTYYSPVNGTTYNAASDPCPVSSPTFNLVSKPSQDATFDSAPDPAVWIHRSAYSNPDTVSTATHLTENIAGNTNGFLRIQSANYFPQTNLPSCGSNCFQWTGALPVANNDLELYANAKIADDAPCGISLPSSATGSFDNPLQCPDQTYQDSLVVSCGYYPTRALLDPVQVCASEPGAIVSKQFDATVSAPPAGQGDTHTYQWFVPAGSPTPPFNGAFPVSGSLHDPSGQAPVHIAVDDVGTQTFQLGLRVTSSKGGPTATTVVDVTVEDCTTPPPPGSDAYQPEPSEDIHGSGRFGLNPGSGTTSTDKILDWREIIGNLDF